MQIHDSLSLFSALLRVYICVCICIGRAEALAVDVLGSRPDVATTPVEQQQQQQKQRPVNEWLRPARYTTTTIPPPLLPEGCSLAILPLPLEGQPHITRPRWFVCVCACKGVNFALSRLHAVLAHTRIDLFFFVFL